MLPDFFWRAARLAIGSQHKIGMGASRRIGRQLLADSVLLAFAGGLLGVVMAPIAVRTLIAFLPQNTAANNLQANVDTRLLLLHFW